jgi:hypothetical protein
LDETEEVEKVLREPPALWREGGRHGGARSSLRRGKPEAAYKHLQRVSDTPDYLPLKARLAYKLNRHDESAAYYAALEALMPLGPEDSIYYVDSLVRCNLLDMARQAASQTLARYPWNASINRLAEILGVARVVR